MILFNQHVPDQYWKVLVLFVVCFLIIGCGPEASAKTQFLAPCESVNAQIYTGNFYPELQSMEAINVADTIYMLAYQNLPLARSKALKFLSYETERWSDIQNFPEITQPNVRVIVTFISPALVRAIVLNQLLAHYNPTQVASLEVATLESLTSLDRKEEFAFSFLIQAREPTPPNNFLIPLADIQLHTTAGTQVKSSHNDDYLNLPITSSEHRYSGFFFYPARVIKNGVCSPLLKPETETSLTLMINTAEIGSQKNVLLHWQIYLPLLAGLNGSLTDTINAVQSSDDATFENPLKENDIKIRNPLPEDASSWRDVGRFIWSKMIMEGMPDQ